MRVRVICERLIRKFGYEYILNLAPEEHRKLLVNINKQKERALKKKREGGAAEGNGDGQEGVCIRYLRLCLICVHATVSMLVHSS